MDKYQQIRIKVESGSSTRINAETDKQYKYVKGIYVSAPQDYMHTGMTLGLKIGQVQLFDDSHETKLLSCGSNVAPNDMFYRFDGKLDAAGSVIEGRLSYNPTYGSSTAEIIIYLWLTNNEYVPK